MGTSDPNGVNAPEFLREVINRLAQPVFVKDASLRYVLANPALAELVGRPSDSLTGLTDYDLFPDPGAELCRASDELVLREGAPFTTDDETVRTAQGEELTVRMVKSPLRDPITNEITHIVGIITDLTHHKRSQDALVSANEELEQRVADRTRALQDAQHALLRKERLTVLGQLAGGLAHQIRNPLAAIATASSILKRKLAGAADPDVQQALAAILEEVWEANRIITDLLDYARIKPPTRGAALVADLVETAIVQSRPPDAVKIEQQIDDDLVVEVDLRQTRDALSNVIRNAFEAMGTAGGRILVTAQRDVEQAVILIEDTGPGLTRAAIAQLFEPLVTSKPLGLGLGLSTARLLIENQGGTIRAATQRGFGARFEIRLPLATSS